MATWIGRGAGGGLLGAALAAAWLALVRMLIGPGAGLVYGPASTALLRLIWQLVAGTAAGGLAGAIFGAFGLKVSRRTLAVAGVVVGLLIWAAAAAGWIAPVFGAGTVVAAIAYGVYGAVAGSTLSHARSPSRSG